MKRLSQTLLALVLFFVSAAGIYNVVADNAEVTRMAEGVACGGDAANVCRAQMTRMERTPFAQTFEFATAKRKVDVRCSRAFVFAGEYACALN